MADGIIRIDAVLRNLSQAGGLKFIGWPGGATGDKSASGMPDEIVKRFNKTSLNPVLLDAAAFWLVMVNIPSLPTVPPSSRLLKSLWPRLQQCVAPTAVCQQRLCFTIFSIVLLFSTCFFSCRVHSKKLGPRRKAPPPFINSESVPLSYAALFHCSTVLLASFLVNAAPTTIRQQRRDCKHCSFAAPSRCLLFSVTHTANKRDASRSLRSFSFLHLHARTRCSLSSSCALTHTTLGTQWCQKAIRCGRRALTALQATTRVRFAAWMGGKHAFLGSERSWQKRAR
jgi:hypothetical protein